MIKARGMDVCCYVRKCAVRNMGLRRRKKRSEKMKTRRGCVVEGGMEVEAV